LEAIDWQDEDGKQRKWETANRKTRSKGGIDAVAILALISHPSRPLSTVIIMQFRVR
jgi:ADP-ribose pyrophosphatase